jgi:hypothetical protein
MMAPDLNTERVVVGASRSNYLACGHAQTARGLSLRSHAKALGLTIPAGMLSIAEVVIE